MHVAVYLSFEGLCEEAIQFYQQAVGAELQFMMRMNEAPPDSGARYSPENANKVMHARFQIGETALMASDGQCSGKPEFKGITLSIHAQSVEEAQRHFNALAQGGVVHMPISPTFWTPGFGMLTDKFGVAWMFNVEHEMQAS